MDYNQTVHLPKTEFPMRAGLPRREPDMLQAMYDKDLYHKLMKKNEGKPKFVLHDGPPYANGNIHIGTALNKILKDMIVKHRNMSGYQAPYVPGWDTHGPVSYTHLCFRPFSARGEGCGSRPRPPLCARRCSRPVRGPAARPQASARAGDPAMAGGRRGAQHLHYRGAGGQDPLHRQTRRP